MEKTTKTTTTTSSSTSKSVKSAGWLTNLISFVAVICIGVALILSKLGFLSSIATALLTIAQTIAFIVVSIVSFFYVYRKKNIWVWLTWIVSVVLIILSYVIKG